jgi:hypothetical protein
MLSCTKACCDEILTVDRADFDVYRMSKGRRFLQVL